MFEWLSQYYLRLIANFQILLTNPTHCSTVDLLNLFTLTLLALFGLKLVLHLLIFRHLRNKYPQYSEASHPKLLERYRRAAEKSDMRRLPRLYQFCNARPLVFTIGSLRPAIFLAPQLVEKLPPDEMEAALVHELTHIKRFDNLLVWFLEMFFVALPVLIMQLFAINFIFSVENSTYAIFGTLAVLIIFKLFVWKRIIFLRELSCDDISVEKLREPLILASSLVNVWRIAKETPKYRWRIGLSFAQTFLPSTLSLEYRVKRLTHYKRPWLKFALGKTARIAALVITVFIMVFLWRFYTTSDHVFAMYVQDGEHRFGVVNNSEFNENDIPAGLNGMKDGQHCITVMKKYSACINSADFSELSVLVDEELKGEFSLAEVQQNHKVLTDYFGKIINVDRPRIISENSAIFTTHFERGVFDVQINLTEEGKISGIAFLPTFADGCKIAG